MNDDTITAFSFPAVSRKKVTAAFDGGRLTSDGGVMLLSLVRRQMFWDIFDIARQRLWFI